MRLFKKKVPETVEVAGHQLRCPVCSNDLFCTRTALMDSTIISFVTFGRITRRATCFVCSKCTHISWFYGK